jgi:hypothetical protein
MRRHFVAAQAILHSPRKPTSPRQPRARFIRRMRFGPQLPFSSPSLPRRRNSFLPRDGKGICAQAPSTAHYIGMPALSELRESTFHQELARKLFIAYVAQHLRVSLSTASKKVEEGPMPDTWLIMADLARFAVESNVNDLLERLNGPSASYSPYIM